MSGKRVMFMTPPYHCGVVESAGRWLPLPLANMAGAVRRSGYEASVYDAMSRFDEYPEIRRRLAEEKPDYLCLTAVTPTVNECVKTAEVAKEILPNVTTIFGGVHPTFCAREMFERHPGAVDCIVRHEGEESLPELLDVLENDGDPSGVSGVAFMDGGRYVQTPQRPFLQDLDAVEPAWDLLEWDIYKYFVIPNSRLAVVSSSRGCTNDCAFCSQQKFWEKGWRARRPDLFVREIEYLHKTYGANVFLITDEYPTRDRDRWVEILDRITALNLPIYLLLETCVNDIVRDADLMDRYRKAGIVHIYIGVEATDQEKLDVFNKNLEVQASREAIQLINDAGMITETSFILGTPTETLDSINETLKLARFYNPDFAHFLALAPWPYANMYGDLKPYIESYDYAKYNLVEPVIKPTSMTLQQVEKEIFNSYRKFYMGKLNEMSNWTDDFKRRYLLSSMKVMMKSSFLAKNLKLLGKVPEKVTRMMAAAAAALEEEQETAIK